MAPTTLMVIALALAISVQGTLGNNLYCKDLNVDACAYAVESSGKRCILEKPLLSLTSSKYTCAASDIVADKLSGWIEAEECISACGVDRKALGISSDSLLDRAFAGKLCSQECYRNCPNIVDLYFNLAAGEGVYLPKFCEARKSKGRREMMEFESSGDNKTAASGPCSAKAPLSPIATVSLAVSADDYSPAPAPGSVVDYPPFPDPYGH